MKLFGVDGCKAGWVVASSQSDLSGLAFRIVPTIDSICAETLKVEAVVTIDIPIGLPASGARGCDLDARQTLGSGQGSRVFPAPARATLAGNSYEECCALNRQASGTAISQQAYGILRKIKEVDSWMTPERQLRVREVHPEVSFCVLNGGPLVHSKKTEEGEQERLAILAQHGVTFHPAAERMALGASKVAVDDLIDAAVALVTAHRVSQGNARILGDRKVDGRGLRMEILA